MFNPKSVETQTQNWDFRFASQKDIVINKVTLAENQDLQEGSVLGKVTATGEYVLSVAAATDGSQVPSVVLVDNAKTASGETPDVPVYESAHLHTTFLKFGAGHDATTVREALREKGIFISPPGN